MRPVGGRVDLFGFRNHGCSLIATIQGEPGLGQSIALSSNRLAIGQPGYQTPDGPVQMGCVGLFHVSLTGAVTREDWLVTAHPGEYTRLGSAIALGLDYLAASAPGLGEEDDGEGLSS